MEVMVLFVMCSFFETCSMNHLDPQQRSTYVLNNLKTTPEDQLLNLLPQNFDKTLLKLVNQKKNKLEKIRRKP